MTLSLTFLPPLLILLFVIFTDKLKEPTSLIVSTFFLGCMLCLPAGLLNHLIIVDDNYSFFAGLTEETLKFLALYFSGFLSHFSAKYQCILSFPDNFREIPVNFHQNFAEKSQNSSKNANER